ncbi:hypothetical protein RRG08_046516 [Elysia crispata]|uniref:Uncharacterized protein n=1 Tax=Elysia crispata TaxID=231223 RepID=A0AAE0Z771_9GAST|nr:hypothetical protein RRG08_046516 [Elysia crispata]
MAHQKALLHPDSTNMSRKFHIRSHTTLPTRCRNNGSSKLASYSPATVNLGFRREQTVYSMCNENYVKMDPVPMVNRPRTAKAVSEAFKGLGVSLYRKHSR